MDQAAIEVWCLLAIAIVFTLLRTYSRLQQVGHERLQADDYLVWVAVVSYIAETSLAFSVGKVANGLANNGLTNEERVALSPLDREYHLRVIGSKLQLGGWSAHSVILWPLKAAMLVFYLRLMTGLPAIFQYRIYFGFALVVSSWIAVVLTILFGCHPFHKNWQIYPDPGNACQPAISRPLTLVYYTMNMVSDLYLIFVPIPMLWQVRLGLLKKLALMVLFSGGLLVIICATIRTALITADPLHGPVLAGSWAVRESFVAIITTNLPMVVQLFNRLSGYIGNSVSAISKSKTPRSGDWSRASRKARRVRSGSIPMSDDHFSLTVTGSEEQIVPREASDPGTEEPADREPRSYIRKDVEFIMSVESDRELTPWAGGRAYELDGIRR